MTMMSRSLFVFALAVLAVFGSSAAAKPKTASKRVAVAAPAPQSKYRRTPYVGAVSAVVNGGRTIFANGAEREAYPASVTKLMTLLLVMEDVRSGKYSYSDSVVATPDAYLCEPSWVGIKAGESMSVRDLCMSLMVESANDAAIVLGVHSAGSFDGFVMRMNSRAAELGMTKTKYYNPNGLPPNSGKRYPWKSFNVTTAADQLKLALRLVTFPEVFEFTSVKTCDLVRTATGFRVSVTRRVNSRLRETKLGSGESIVKQMCNHNNVMVKDKLKIFNPDGSEAVDGFKTGYIDAGGSSVVVTAKRGKERVVVVVLGSSSAKERDSAVTDLVRDALGACSL